MVIEDPSRVGPGGALRTICSPLRSEPPPALICEGGLLKCFYQTFQRASLNFCASQHVRPNLFSGSILIFSGVFLSFWICLCLQGWPMNRQLCKGPKTFHRSVSLFTQMVAEATKCMLSSARISHVASHPEPLEPLLFLQCDTRHLCLGLLNLVK